MILGAAAMLPAAAFAETPQNAISPDAALARLIEGNARYAENKPTQQDYSAGRARRSVGQHPIAAILSCSDSRVAPELAFDQGPGDLFVVRVAGNFVNDDGLASIEYAIKYLGAPLIMVLGHVNCGAVDATIKVVRDNVTLPGHLPDMIREIKPAVEVALRDHKDDVLAAAIIENVRLGVHRLEAADPILSGFVQQGRLKIVGGLYDLSTGKISLI
ncbi:carbonic anhydrase [Pseudochelatococcus sp. G4_1912]|uniref:carbonic anhydrase n=1 Tax=Pseudochelatococcus sp. G4_1912 TaxID=3114288 RepID=UPI0039C5BE59